MSTPRPPAPPDPSAPDPWARLRLATRARIGLGRAGDSLPTPALLDFQYAHARARDAVHKAADLDAIAAALAPVPVLRVHSAAPDRATYLRRPDLGRRLDDASAAQLQAAAADPPWDLVLVVADGLSAAAVEAQAVPTVRAILRRLPELSVGPVVLAAQARVALGDAVGQRLGARLVAVLVGERPGLSVADSLGIYLTYAPREGRRDSERNCLSNIHADGLSPEAAADTLAWLAGEALRRCISGVALKEEAPKLQETSTAAIARIEFSSV